LNETHIEIIAETGADIFGVRGAVCVRNRADAVEAGLVKKIIEKIRITSD